MDMFFFLYGLLVFIANICFYVYFWFKLDELKAAFRVSSSEVEGLKNRIRQEFKIDGVDFSNMDCSQAIVYVLSANHSLSAKEIADKLSSMGFTSNSKNFEGIVYNTLYNNKRNKQLFTKKGKLWSLNKEKFQEI